MEVMGWGEWVAHDILVTANSPSTPFPLWIRHLGLEIGLWTGSWTRAFNNWIIMINYLNWTNQFGQHLWHLLCQRLGARRSQLRWFAYLMLLIIFPSVGLFLFSFDWWSRIWAEKGRKARGRGYQDTAFPRQPSGQHHGCIFIIYCSKKATINIFNTSAFQNQIDIF